MTDAYTAALRILSYRFNSEAELRRKLRAKKFEEQEIDAAIARLRNEKWIDDARFAGAFVRTRAQKRIGPARIRLELIAAGVERTLAAAAVRENLDPEREREGLTALAAKKLRLLRSRHGADVLSTPAGRKKLAAYLLKQGYDAALVAEVVGEFDD
jgi:regulatory protein